MRGGSDTTAATVPFIVQATATTLNGVAVPAGVYMADAFIKNGAIVNAKIANAAIDNAKISSLSADKITAGTVSTARLNIDGATLSANSNGELVVNAINANQITAGTIDATIMSGTTVYADKLTGDVSKLLPFRSTAQIIFRGNTASGGGTKILTTQQLPASTHPSGHKAFTSVTGWYDSTANKTYSFKLYMQDTSGSSGYVLVGETRFKANTNLYAQFALSGSLTNPTTGVVNMKLEVTRTGTSGVYANDNSTATDVVSEVSGFMLGAR